MKKIILSALVTFSVLLSYSQTKSEGFKKSDLFLTGKVTVSSSSTGDAKESTFEFNPSLGYFISDNLALGVNAGIGATKSKVSSTTIADESTFSAGAFARYYTTPSKKFSGMFNLGFNYFSANDKIGKVKNSGFDLSFSPGINYFLSNNFAVEASYGVLGFSTEKSNVPGSDATRKIDVNLNLTSISFGLVYKL